MSEETLKTLEAYKQLLLDEFQEYVKLNGASAKWKLEYYKNHKETDKIVELFGMPQLFDLASYYAYGNAKDIVEEKFNEIIKNNERNCN